MKFLLAISLLFLGACSSGDEVIEEGGVTEKQLPSPTLENLKKQEFERPEDPNVKEQLALTYWCRGQKGLAYEHWLWIVQFDKDSPRAQRAQKNLKILQKDPTSDLEIGCPH